MTKLFGLDLHENTLLLSMIGGVLWLFVHNYILAPFLYSPLAYVLCDVQKPENEKQKLDLEEKLPFYFGKAIYGSITLGIWINYASTHPGWENFWEWDQYCYRLPLSHPEYKDVLPIYVWYFAYVFFVFMKDFFKSYRKDAGWSQYLFDFHHLIAIGLVYMSITYGWWRGGFLTRITHDPADVILYWMKVFGMSYENRSGRKNDVVHKSLISILLFSWISTRVVAYGWFTYAMLKLAFEYDATKDTSGLTHLWDMYILLAGTLLMFLLQVVWLVGISRIWIKRMYNRDYEKKQS